MKYLIFIGLFIAGGTIGYFVGKTSGQSAVDDNFTETERITEFIYDTIVEKERIEVPVYTTPVVDTNIVEPADSLEDLFVLDTLKERILPRDSVGQDEELNINRDELIASKRISIQYLDELVEKDSVIKDLLGIKQNRPAEMIVQFWTSPLNFSGYKLSRNTLVLYDLSAQFDYSIYFKENRHYLSNETVFYVLEETTDFLPYQEVDKNEILDD